MTDQQKLFADQYLILNHGTKAAIAAGYSEKSARSQASQLLVIEEIEEYIEERRKAASEISLVDLAWVQTRFKEVSDRCMQAEPVLIWDGTDYIESGEYKFDSSGVVNSTRELAKIIGAYEKDNDQRKPKNEIDLSKLSDEAVNAILNASK